LGRSQSRRRHNELGIPSHTRSRESGDNSSPDLPTLPKERLQDFQLAILRPSYARMWDLPGTSLRPGTRERVLVPPVRLRSVTAISPLPSPLSHTLDHALMLLMNTSLYDTITHIDASNSASDLAPHQTPFVEHAVMRCFVFCRSTCDRVC
jgi:hypothetical protein